MSREKRNVADRVVLHVLAACCVVAALLRVVLGDRLDLEVLYFLLGAAVIVVIDSVQKLKFGSVELERFEKLEGRIEELADVADSEYAAPSARPVAAAGPAAAFALGSADDAESRPFEFDREVATLSGRLYPDGLRWSDDPVEMLKAPSSVNGHALKATVLPSRNFPDAFRVIIKLLVDAAVAERRDQRVAFFLHQTFPNRVRITESEGGMATLTLISRGTFTVGALLPDGAKLMLELCSADLSGLSRAQRSLFENN